MPIKAIVRKNEYQDSVRLMNISKQASAAEGVSHVLVLLGTEGNKKVLSDLALLDDIVDAATPNDLIICIDAASEAAWEHALGEVDRLLGEKAVATATQNRPETIEEAVAQLPGANFALFSVPGKYAKLDVAIALENQLNVMLFSDNVPVADEIELKQLACSRGLLMMGPDCGTAIINGVCFGFANVVRRGAVGVIGASGTGIQEVTCLIDRMGGGISHAIGVGGRDLKQKVGGVMMSAAIAKLAEDPATDRIVLISKPGDPGAMEKVMSAARASGMPVTACFLGREAPMETGDGVEVVRTLEAAAYAVSGHRPGPQALPPELVRRRKACPEERKYLRGLYSGGTLCTESLLLFDGVLDVRSNIAFDPLLKLPFPARSEGHYCIDMGEDEFTDGRPHPMIDSSLRCERILESMADPSVRVLLLDVMLGYGSCQDPAGDIVEALQQGARNAPDGGPIVLAHVCGTPGDPQDLKAQEKKLEAAGVFLFDANAAAARAAMQLVSG